MCRVVMLKTSFFFLSSVLFRQRREKFLQSGIVKVEELGAGEITNILADLPSTNLDSDNEQEESKSPSPPMEEERTKPRLEWQRGEEKAVPDRQKEVGDFNQQHSKHALQNY